MGEKRVRGYVFRWRVSDHPPRHVHIYRDGRRIGRWDIDNGRPMDPIVMTRRLEEALEEAGFPKGEEE